MSVHRPGVNHNGPCFRREDLLRSLFPRFSDAVLQNKGSAPVVVGFPLGTKHNQLSAVFQNLARSQHLS